jgi:hypothetical protein
MELSLNLITETLSGEGMSFVKLGLLVIASCLVLLAVISVVWIVAIVRK